MSQALPSCESTNFHNSYASPKQEKDLYTHNGAVHDVLIRHQVLAVLLGWNSSRSFDAILEAEGWWGWWEWPPTTSPTTNNTNQLKKEKKKNHFSPTSPTYLDSVKKKFLAEFLAINPISSPSYLRFQATFLVCVVAPQFSQAPLMNLVFTSPLVPARWGRGVNHQWLSPKRTGRISILEGKMHDTYSGGVCFGHMSFAEGWQILWGGSHAWSALIVSHTLLMCKYISYTDHWFQIPLGLLCNCEDQWKNTPPMVQGWLSQIH